MSAPDLAERPPLDGVPEPEIRAARRGPSPAWLVPIVAALIAGWVAWTTYASRGPTITISFETAEGLEAERTRVRFRDIDVGTVQRLAISPDRRRVIVTVRMQEGTEPLLTEATRFWIVRPRIGVGGVSGLGTLLSGAYVEIEPGEGEAAGAREFVGLEEPPLISASVPGTRFVLRAPDLGSISRGAPVYYRGVDVGQVLGYELAEDSQQVHAPIFVRAPHDQLVRAATRFWNASGLRLRAGAEGVSVEIAALQSLLLGGIAFETPPAERDAPIAAADTTFPLYESEQAAERDSGGERVPYLVQFEGSARGLRPGAPVEIRGIRIGEVRTVDLAADVQRGELLVQALVEIEPARIRTIDAATGTPLGPQPIEVLVERGLRAQLRTGNLLTGDLYVEVDLFQGVPRAELRMIGPLTVIPAIPTQLDTLSASVTGILEKLAALPLDELIAELRTAVAGVARLTNDPALASTLAELEAAIRSLQQTSASIAGGIDPLFADLRVATGTASTALQQGESALRQLNDILGPNSRLRFDLNEALREFATAARAIRSFADYLERNPEALIRGRAGGYR